MYLQKDVLGNSVTSERIEKILLIYIIPTKIFSFNKMVENTTSKVSDNNGFYEVKCKDSKQTN